MDGCYAWAASATKPRGAAEERDELASVEQIASAAPNQGSEHNRLASSKVSPQCGISIRPMSGWVNSGPRPLGSYVSFGQQLEMHTAAQCQYLTSFLNKLNAAALTICDASDRCLLLARSAHPRGSRQYR